MHTQWHVRKGTGVIVADGHFLAINVAADTFAFTPSGPEVNVILDRHWRTFYVEVEVGVGQRRGYYDCGVSAYTFFIQAPFPIGAWALATAPIIAAGQRFTDLSADALALGANLPICAAIATDSATTPVIQSPALARLARRGLAALLLKAHEVDGTATTFNGASTAIVKEVTVAGVALFRDTTLRFIAKGAQKAPAIFHAVDAVLT